MIVMVLVFTIPYPITIAREGVRIRRMPSLSPIRKMVILYIPAKSKGSRPAFAVYADKTVEFQYNGRIYGPYIAKEDPTAIPKDSEVGESMTGVELRHGEEILFRGGVLDLGDYHLLYSEDGSLENINISVTTSDGIVMDENGSVIDPMEPSVSTILDLMAGPELTHKGGWPAWFGGVFVCIVTTILILFADELFRWNSVFPDS